MKKLTILFIIITSGLLFPSLSHGESLSKGTSIEVIGYAELDKGDKVAELQRRAIKDALKNALLLSNCTVAYTTVLEDLKLKSSSITFKSSGFVKSSKVLLSEFVKKTDPQLYKVILQVTIFPIVKTVK